LKPLGYSRLSTGDTLRPQRTPSRSGSRQ
jgi:hypothetical protein